MITTILAALAILAVEHHYPAARAIATEGGALAFVTNVHAVNRYRHLIIMQPPLPEGEIARFNFPSGTGQVTRTGPVSWGVVGGTYFYVRYSEDAGRTTTVFSQSIADKILDIRDGRAGHDLDSALMGRMRHQMDEYGRRYAAFDLFMLRLDATAVGWKAKGLWFDVTYTDTNHPSTFVVHDGNLHWWSWNKPEEGEWVEHPTLPTEITGAFRAIQAGDNLYLIDGDGRVFSSPATGHQQLGSITGWDEVREGERLIVLEEQRDGKILVVKVVEGVPTVLEFAGDAVAGRDFVTDIGSPELRDAIIRMVEILDDASSGGG